VNPFGDEALAMLPEWWAKGPCVTPCAGQGGKNAAAADATRAADATKEDGATGDGENDRGDRNGQGERNGQGGRGAENEGER
jgi:hypothetical protein